MRFKLFEGFKTELDAIDAKCKLDKDILTNRYINMIKNCTEGLSDNYDVRYITPVRTEPEDDSILIVSIDPDLTLDNFQDFKSILIKDLGKLEMDGLLTIVELGIINNDDGHYTIFSGSAEQFINILNANGTKEFYNRTWQFPRFHGKNIEQFIDLINMNGDGVVSKIFIDLTVCS